MKLYIWEGNGISDAYHDDGTLVVLAESAEQAREVARASQPVDGDKQYESTFHWFDRVEWKDELNERVDVAIDRDPDRVIELDAPTVVAFNGGGYD